MRAATKPKTQDTLLASNVRTVIMTKSVKGALEKELAKKKPKPRKRG